MTAVRPGSSPPRFSTVDSPLFVDRSRETPGHSHELDFAMHRFAASASAFLLLLLGCASEGGAALGSGGLGGRGHRELG